MKFGKYEQLIDNIGVNFSVGTLLLVSMGWSHGLRLASFVKVVDSIFVCMAGLAMTLQEVSIKKFINQEVFSDAPDQFK